MNDDYVVPSFLLIVLMIGIVAEKEGVASAAHIIAFSLAASAWFIRNSLKNPR